MVVSDQARGTGRVGVEHGGRIAELLRRVNEHSGELAAARDAKGGARGDEGIARDRGCDARQRAGRLGRPHLSSALIARAASVWRTR
jgi:hypothetical protein